MSHCRVNRATSSNARGIEITAVFRSPCQSISVVVRSFSSRLALTAQSGRPRTSNSGSKGQGTGSGAGFLRYFHTWPGNYLFAHCRFIPRERIISARCCEGRIDRCGGMLAAHPPAKLPAGVLCVSRRVLQMSRGRGAHVTAAPLNRVTRDRRARECGRKGERERERPTRGLSDR